MSVNLRGAFDMLISKKSRPATMRDRDTNNYSIKIAPSNYSRNLEALSNTVIDGHEFVIPLSSIPDGAPEPRRGFRIIDSIGDYTISSVETMYGISDEVLGYRVRTS